MLRSTNTYFPVGRDITSKHSYRKNEKVMDWKPKLEQITNWQQIFDTKLWVIEAITEDLFLTLKFQAEYLKKSPQILIYQTWWKNSFQVQKTFTYLFVRFQFLRKSFQALCKIAHHWFLAASQFLQKGRQSLLQIIFFCEWSNMAADEELRNVSLLGRVSRLKWIVFLLQIKHNFYRTKNQRSYRYFSFAFVKQKRSITLIFIVSVFQTSGKTDI